MWLISYYASIVYSSARPVVLKMLDSVHNSFISLSTGASRCCRLASLGWEALPLEQMTATYSLLHGQCRSSTISSVL